MFKRLSKASNKIRATVKKWYREHRVLITASSVAGTVIVLRSFGLLQFLELAAWDQFFRWRSLEAVDERIVIVAINEADLQKFNYPIPDGVMAELLQKLHAGQPRAIGLDIYRDLPVEPGHEKLVKAFETIPNVIGIENTQNENLLGVRPPTVLSEQNRVGLNNVVVDGDGKVRRALLYSWLSDGKTRESLALKLALIYLEDRGITPQPAKTNPKYLQLGKGVFKRFKAHDGAYIQAEDRGYQILANLRGPAGSFRSVSMTDVLSGKMPPDFVRSRIVLIGSTATSLKDFQRTSYSSGLLDSPDWISGVELQAHFLSQILSAALEGRTSFKVWPDWAEWLWICGWSWVGALVSWKVRSPQFSLLSLLGVGISLSTSLYLAFLIGWWLPLIPPLIAIAGSAAAINSYLAHLQEELKRSKEFLQTVINTIPDPIFVNDKNHRRIVLNQAYCRLIGQPLSTLMSKTDYDLFPKHEAEIFWQQDELVFTTQEENENEEEFTDASGTTHLIATKRSLHKDAAGNLFLVGAIRDITERKRMEEELKKKNAELLLSEDRLRYQAYHDPLTGLPNRQMFYERLNQCIEQAASKNKLVALLFLDLDRFKLINDSLGHDIGDLLLKGVAERLKGCLRGSDTISRLGGDEFTVILPGIPGKADAARVAEKIRDAITEVFILEDHKFSITTSIGISLYPLDGQDKESLIKNADTAMYRAKELGKNRFEFY
ncbi:diguanylate cyclase [Oscillatoriales cyanobacterium USR001]|nr:diguanylate cyclase [Oscillatoriales cyanobacterium USR001]